jgi:hypothetical protein
VLHGHHRHAAFCRWHRHAEQHHPEGDDPVCGLFRDFAGKKTPCAMVFSEIMFIFATTMTAVVTGSGRTGVSSDMAKGRETCFLPDGRLTDNLFMLQKP